MNKEILEESSGFNYLGHQKLKLRSVIKYQGLTAPVCCIKKGLNKKT